MVFDFLNRRSQVRILSGVPSGLSAGRLSNGLLFPLGSQLVLGHEINATGHEADQPQPAQQPGEAPQKLVVIQLTLPEVFVKLNRDRTGVTNRVVQVDREHRRAGDLGRGDHPLEQHRAVRHVGKVGAHANEDHPPQAADHFAVVQQCRTSHQHDAQQHDG